MLAARQRFPANFITRRTLAVATLSVTGMFAAASYVLALQVTIEDFVASNFLAQGTTAAGLANQFQALATFPQVTPFAAAMLLTFQVLLASISARSNVLGARRDGASFATRTSPRQSQRTLAAVTFVANLFAAVQSARVLLAANLPAGPTRLGTVHLFGTRTTRTFLLAAARTRRTLRRRVAHTATLVDSAVPFELARL